MAIVFAAWFYVVSTSGTPAAGGAASRLLLPFQTVIQAYGVEDQRTFRELRVALIEAENLRSLEGRWPAVAVLTAQGIEPFARDRTNRGAVYSWSLRQEGAYVSYLGVPDRPGATAWLAVIQEPDPALPPEPYQDDEEHARLLDGTQLHVSVWSHQFGAQAAVPSARSPQLEGWVQVFAVGPSSTH
ncbi:MAG: hypothetical protein AB7O32_20105 [Vicinamibacterales bacterium]